MPTDENGMEYEEEPLSVEDELAAQEASEDEEIHRVEGIYNLPKTEKKGYHSYDYIPQNVIKAQENAAAVAAGQEPPNKYWENPQNIVEGRGGYNGETAYDKAKREAKEILKGNDVKGISERLNEEELQRKLLNKEIILEREKRRKELEALEIENKKARNEARLKRYELELAQVQAHKNNKIISPELAKAQEQAAIARAEYDLENLKNRKGINAAEYDTRRRELEAQRIKLISAKWKPAINALRGTFSSAYMVNTPTAENANLSVLYARNVQNSVHPAEAPLASIGGSARIQPVPNIWHSIGGTSSSNAPGDVWKDIGGIPTRQPEIQQPVQTPMQNPVAPEHPAPLTSRQLRRLERYTEQNQEHEREGAITYAHVPHLYKHERKHRPHYKIVYVNQPREPIQEGRFRA